MKVNKKLFGIILSASMVTTMFQNPMNVYATQFEGKEEQYIKLCSSSNLSESKQKTCKEFNAYLRNKNKELDKDIESTKNDKKKTEESIDELKNKIIQIDKDIVEANKEIKYVKINIKNLEKEIVDKDEKMRDRIYATQTNTNANSFLIYILNAKGFSDFFSRVAQISEITAYEKELMDELKSNKKEVELQAKALAKRKKTLDAKKSEQKELQKKLAEKLSQQNSNLESMENETKHNSESMDIIKKNLAALEKASNDSKLPPVDGAINDKKPVKPKPPKPPVEDNSKPDGGNPPQDNNSSDNDKDDGSLTDEEQASIELGLKIANKALTRQGYMYVWGGAHSMKAIMDPNHTEFDCSDFVNWAYYQSGVNIGVQYTGSLVYMGTRVEREDLQAGDIILFSNNGAVSGVHHVGIYIGGNRMVHAPTTGMPVQVASLNSAYWQREWLVSRRLY